MPSATAVAGAFAMIAGNRTTRYAGVPERAMSGLKAPRDESARYGVACDATSRLLLSCDFLAAADGWRRPPLPSAASISSCRERFEVEAVRRPAVRRGADHASSCRQEMLPEPLGIEGIGLSEKHGRVLYPAIDNPAFGKLHEGGARRQHAADDRRAGARASGRAAAGNPRPAAADDPLFPLPRRRAAGLVARSRARPFRLTAVPRQRSGRPPAAAATVVAAIRQAGRAVRAEARLSAGGRQLS